MTIDYLLKYISFDSYNKLVHSGNSYVIELFSNNMRNVNLNCQYLIGYGVSNIESVILNKAEDITLDHDLFIDNINTLEKKLSKKDVIALYENAS